MTLEKVLLYEIGKHTTNCIYRKLLVTQGNAAISFALAVRMCECNWYIVPS